MPTRLYTGLLGLAGLLLLAGCASAPAGAPTGSPDTAAERTTTPMPGAPTWTAASADAAWRAEDWATAVVAYRQLVATNPGNAPAALRLAGALRARGALAAAREVLDELAGQAAAPAAQLALERARLAALEGDARGAAALVAEAVAAGMPVLEPLLAAPELTALAGDPVYDQALATLTATARPCRADGDFRAFDFWVGDWDVYVGNGVLAGSNRIRPAEQGCVLIETWTSSSGSTGRSMNFHDPVAGTWRQLWVSQGGVIIDISGGLDAAGAMVLTGWIHYAGNASSAPFRGTWTPMPEGRVRQFFEQSPDDGSTWQPWFLGIYVPAGSGPP